MNVWQKFKGWIAKKMNFTVETSPAMKEESFLEWLGVKRKNKDVMAEVTYFTCLKMMSETLAKIPWKYYQKTECFTGIRVIKYTMQNYAEVEFSTLQKI